MQARSLQIPQQVRGDAFLTTRTLPGRILYSNASFREEFHQLTRGDCIVGRLNLKNSEESLFLDLVERGVILIPSALSQQLSRSKCLQAVVYEKFMVPGTTAARRKHDLVACIEKFGRRQVKAVITKQDRLDCGLGINRWNNIEDVYNAACFSGLEFPFVIQPFISGATDIRVIIIGDYHEAYWRRSQASFRNNLHFGGESGSYVLSQEHKNMCREIMTRGKFPYAHIDLMLTPEGTAYLSEINLRGGIKGAKITPSEYGKLVDGIHQKLASKLAK